jgi:cytochrome c peroxidase
VPPPDASGFRNDPIRQVVLARLNASPQYRKLFGNVFPSVKNGGPIDFQMFGMAIAEFEFSIVFANAPIDQFARGDLNAMTAQEKRGALVFFGKGKCVACHAVAGKSNEMFSDFENRVIGVPQIAPEFGVKLGNVIFDGPGQDEDFGLEQVTGDSADRYKFRTAPLRNLALAPAFFHNGSFTQLRDAIVHHLGPIEPVLARLDPLLKTPIQLSGKELEDLTAFVRDGLLDSRLARHSPLCSLIPSSIPSGATPLQFENCR